MGGSPRREIWDLGFGIWDLGFSGVDLAAQDFAQEVGRQ